MNEAPKDTVDIVREFNDDNVVDIFAPRPKPDGVEPPKVDWLSRMESGTQFLCRDKTGQMAPKWLVFEYIHGGKLKGHVWLIPRKTMNDVTTWTWCVPEDFSKAFEFRGIIVEEPETVDEDPVP